MPYDSYADTSAPESDSNESEPEKEDADASSTDLLSKRLFAGKDFKVGDEIVLEITHIYEDQFAVKYAKEKSSEHTEAEEPDYSGEMSMKE